MSELVCAFCHRSHSELKADAEIMIALKVDQSVCICSQCVSIANDMPNAIPGHEDDNKAKVIYLGDPDVDNLRS